jgi:hypothetical protein
MMGPDIERCALRLESTPTLPVLFLITALGWSLACAKPAPDTDGSSAQARGLALGVWHTDQLQCRSGDCSDWYRVDLGARGDLVIDATSPDGVARSFNLSLASASAEVLTRASGAGTGRAQVTWATSAGTYLIEVSSADQERKPQRYQIQARFTPEPPPPPPPEPQFHALDAEVIEIEGRAGKPDAVLIDKGSQAGVRRGLEGRLYDAGTEIGQIEVDETYPEGARATIRGSLSAPVTPATRAEIDIPLDEYNPPPEEP